MLLESTLGAKLPRDLRAHPMRYGKESGAPLYEYSGLGTVAIGETWSGLEELRLDGTFDDWEPHEMIPDQHCLQRTWWHPGWIPFASDGGGNLRCVDLPTATSFEEFLRRYGDKLVGGRLRYDPNSGIFDE